MNFPDLATNNNDLQWQRFCDLLWFSEKLGIWLDISRMNINKDEFQELELPLK